MLSAYVVETSTDSLELRQLPCECQGAHTSAFRVEIFMVAFYIFISPHI